MSSDIKLGSNVAPTLPSGVYPTLASSLNLKEYPNDDFSHILGYGDSNHQLSRLQDICGIRLKDVNQDKKPIDTQGCGLDRSFYISEDDLHEEIRDNLATRGPPLDLYTHINQSFPRMAIAAEFKKASPSKGPINMDADPVEQCLQYARAGVSVISVLTEFKHFKGTLNHLKSVRKAVQDELGSNRPAILRKDFIIDRYQILEARAAGADTVLLIVAVLGVKQLKDLMDYSRSLGMEPLVEINNETEMKIAINAGARVIGVNNRNLHNFQLDLDTTTRAVNVADALGLSHRISDSSKSPDILIAALSGISTASEVQGYYDMGIACCLIGETLMKSPDPKTTINEFASVSSRKSMPETVIGSDSKVDYKLVKTCGYVAADEALHSVQQGTNLLGIIFAERSMRKASIEQAANIVANVRRYGERTESKANEIVSCMRQLKAQLESSSQGGSYSWFAECGKLLGRITLRQPLAVGVFQDQSVEYINEVIAATGIDIVQLHGQESHDIVDRIQASVIKVLHLPIKNTDTATTAGPQETIDIESLTNSIRSWSGKAIAILLDSKMPGKSTSGGAGQEFDWTIIDSHLHRNQIAPVLLAGGLNSSNVREALSIPGVIGVDVSSGLEMKDEKGSSIFGRKDPKVVKEFVRNAKFL